MATVDIPCNPIDIAAGVASHDITMIIDIPADDLDTGSLELDEPAIKIFPEPWPFPAASLKEQLQWLTDPLGSRTGEQRLALRKAPRQMFSWGWLCDQDEYARGKRMGRERGATFIGFPVWSESVKLDVTVDAAATSILLDTTTADWRVDDMVLFWKSSSQYKHMLVQSISDTEIFFHEAIGEEFIRPDVMPVRRCRFLDGVTGDRLSYYVEVRSEFLVIDSIDLSANWVTDFDQYEGLDVITERPEIVSRIAEKLIRSSTVVDNQFGPVDYEPAKDYADFGQTLGFLDERPGPLWRRRLWLHSLRGKQKAFWLPTFNNDLELMVANNGISPVLTVRNIGPAAAPALSYTGNHIFIEMQDGTHYYKQIIGAADNGTTDDIQISSAFGVAIDPADIAIFGFMHKVRLDSDTVEIEHRPSQISLTTIPVIEVLE